jgi:hypothetical protein
MPLASGICSACVCLNVCVWRRVDDDASFACMCAHMCACMCVCMRVCAHVCVRACVHACVRACVCACMCACVRACAPQVQGVGPRIEGVERGCMAHTFEIVRVGAWLVRRSPRGCVACTSERVGAWLVRRSPRGHVACTSERVRGDSG